MKFSYNFLTILVESQVEIKIRISNSEKWKNAIFIFQKLNFLNYTFYTRIHLVLCFMSQLEYRSENQNFIFNIVFQFIKKNEMAI